jgi:predicted transcriptional regulator YdeE
MPISLKYFLINQEKMMLKTLLFISSIASGLSMEASSNGEIENSMPYTMEKQQKKLIMGIQIRTSNDVCQTDMPQIWQKFFQEKILEKIPHKVNQTIYAVYTDYDGDYTKPYSYILGCEVSTLDNIPEGMVGTVVPASSYAVYKTTGTYPQGLASIWQMIWKAPYKRAYTTDFEVYGTDFNPQTKPEVKVYIAL